MSEEVKTALTRYGELALEHAEAGLQLLKAEERVAKCKEAKKVAHAHLYDLIEKSARESDHA